MFQQEEYQDQANVEEMSHQQEYQLQEIIEYQRSSTEPTDISQEINLVQEEMEYDNETSATDVSRNPTPKSASLASFPE
jgi:hypothetical protein